MKDVVGSSSEEVRMIKAIQRSVGALENGWIGNQTLSDTAAKPGADCWPLNVELYGQPCIIARDIEPVNMSGPPPRPIIITSTFPFSLKYFMPEMSCGAALSPCTSEG